MTLAVGLELLTIGLSWFSVLCLIYSKEISFSAGWRDAGWLSAEMKCRKPLLGVCGWPCPQPVRPSVWRPKGREGSHTMSGVSFFDWMWRMDSLRGWVKEAQCWDTACVTVKSVSRYTTQLLWIMSADIICLGGRLTVLTAVVLCGDFTGTTKQSSRDSISYTQFRGGWGVGSYNKSNRFTI